MSNQRVSEIVKKYLLERNSEHIAYGHLCELDDCFKLAFPNSKIYHPLNRHHALLNALGKESKFDDAIFEKHFFLANRGLARYFKIKKNEP